VGNKEQRRGGTGKGWSFRLIEEQDVAEATRYALSAANYHFRGLRHHLKALNDAQLAGGEFDARARDNFNKFYHYLRAFFWELCASFDTLLQEINRRLELSISEREVGWNTVSQALSVKPEYKKFLSKLSRGFNSEWFTEVREYRNFAHRGTIIVESASLTSDLGTDRRGRLVGLMLRPVSGGRGAGEPVVLCREYGKHVDELVRWALGELDGLRPQDSEHDE
jgi:hypothetical protein